MNINIKPFLLKSLLLIGMAFSLTTLPAAAQQLPQLEWVGKMEEIAADVKSTINSSGDIFTYGSFGLNPDFNIGIGTFTLQGWNASGAFICKTFANGDFAWVRGFALALGSIIYFPTIIAPPVTDKLGNVYMFVNGNSLNQPAGQEFFIDYGTGVVDTFSFPAPSLGNSSSNDYILKFNAQGQLVWLKWLCSGAMGSNALYESAAVTDDYGNIYLAQAFSDTLIFSPDGLADTLVLPSGQSGVFLCKLDSAGNVLWNRSILTSENPYWGDLKMATDGKNALFISGGFVEAMDFDPGPGTTLLNPDSVGTIFVDKLDLNGNFLKAFGTGRQANGLVGVGLQAMAVDVSGNSYLTGTFVGNAIDFDPGPDSLILSAPAQINSVFVTKFSVEGSLEWAKPLYKMHKFGSSGMASHDIAVDAKGHVFLTGEFNGVVDFDPGPDSFNLSNNSSNTAFVCKLEASGDLGWAFAMEHSGQGNGGSGTSIDVTDSGDIYTTGFFTIDTIDFDPGPGTLNLSPKLWSAAFIQKLKDNSSTGIGNLGGNESSSTVQLYPNPAGNELWLKSNGKVQLKTVLVYNMLGQELRREKVGSGSFYRMDVRSLAPGFYLLKALLSDGSVAQGKFEVQR